MPDFNIGTNGGLSCAAAIETATRKICAAASGYSHVVNGRFKGGWTTRHYGRPGQGVHAIQMELTQATHLAGEAPPFAYSAEKGRPVARASSRHPRRTRTHRPRTGRVRRELTAHSRRNRKMNNPRHNIREVRAPRGDKLNARSWLTEAPLRMLMNNLDPEVAENPNELVVYGGIGRAARTWNDFDRIVASLKTLGDDETLLVQSGKPVGVFRTHPDAPRVLIANSNLVPHWANWAHFNELDRKGLMMYGQMTAGSWIYIGTQGIVQGTYETFVEAGRQHYGGNLRGKWILTAGLGGMGGAQPLAAVMAGACCLAVECDPDHIDFRLRTRYVDERADTLDEALAMIDRWTSGGRGEIGRPARQRRRNPARAGQARRQARHGHRPDLGA